MKHPDHGYWRSLAELGALSGVDNAAEGEFPESALAPPDGVSRRDFVRLLGASAALAGLTACMRAPAKRILPYTERPPEITPGIPLHYATSMELDGFATGLLVTSHEGRPTKIEGNPQHPASLGAAGVYEQASVLQLYDPDRARAPRQGRSRTSWDAFAREFGALSANDIGARGAGLHVLLEPTSSPVIGDLLGRLRTRYPDASVHFYAPLATGAPLAGARVVLGDAIIPQYDVRRANVILALDADFLASMPFNLRYAHDFADGRRLRTPDEQMNRLYVVESMLSPTGSIADNRLRARMSDAGPILAAVFAAVLRAGGTATGVSVPPNAAAMLERVAGGAPSEWVTAIASDLRTNMGRSLVIVGDHQPPAVHAMGYLLNTVLGNLGSTVWFTRSPIIDAGAPSHGLRPLADALRGGAVHTLVIAHANPVYDAPPELEFARALRSAKRTAYLGLYDNETARECQWLVPGTHYLEAWGDARAYDGTLSLVQPLIAPLYHGKTMSELLSTLAGVSADAHTLLQQSWSTRAGGATSGPQWDDLLRLGFARDSALPRATASPQLTELGALVDSLATAQRPSGSSVELALVHDHSVYDGRFANLGWLQELPRPMTKITWDNAAVLSPATARRLGVETNDVLTLHVGSRSVSAPAFVLPGHADDAITLALGYGREGSESIARGVGSNAYVLRESAAPFIVPARVERARASGGSPLRHALATTQVHWYLEGRPIVHETVLDAYRRDPDFTRAQRGHVLSLYKPHDYQTGDQWAMTIDLGTCIGCGACALACQAENNVPVVGRDGVLKSREMHWLRIDRYFTGTPEDPHVINQPMLCQHCEQAPCEYVCPVNATVHSDDGLNEMVYNRCVGTRFCSNNCPYKVRRFNWFNYRHEVAETVRMVMNPDVTVRERGVMEKCSFCVQRIRRSQIAAQVEGRAVHDGEVVTACQQACPTRAIVFGSYTDPAAQVVQTRAQPRRYSVLHELGTRPRVEYLARITNPNPALEKGGAVEE
jgi:molybdopterin-containing oxidoreductase family iron-sulfur binding subunit